MKGKRSTRAEIAVYCIALAGVLLYLWLLVK
jgi:hypothetical protein